MRSRKKASVAGPHEREGREAGKVTRIPTGRHITAAGNSSTVNTPGGTSLVLWVIARLCLTHGPSKVTDLSG